MTAKETRPIPALTVHVSDDEKRVLISWGKGPQVVVDDSGAVTEQVRFEGDCIFESGQPGWDAGYSTGYNIGHDEGYEQASRDAASPTAAAS